MGIVGLGIFGLRVTKNPAPKFNLVVSAFFVCGSLALFVNAIFFEPLRCSKSTVDRFSTKNISECGHMLGPGTCYELDGLGSAVFDKNSCGERICIQQTRLQTVPNAKCLTITDTVFTCNFVWAMAPRAANLVCSVSGLDQNLQQWTQADCGNPSLRNGFEDYNSEDSAECRELLTAPGNCTGQVAFDMCTDYNRCDALYAEDLILCPSVFGTLGIASGYISLLMTSCALLYRIYAQLTRGAESSASTANA